MNIVIFGGGGFIGHHLAKKLKTDGNYVICVDIKSKKEASEYCKISSYCNKYISVDLSDYWNVAQIIKKYQPDELYQLAADMGGAGYIFSGLNDSNIMQNSVAINLNTLKALVLYSIKTKVFYSSSACMYPAFNQEDPNNPNCKESSAYPAEPDSEYGWEKLFSERMYLAFNRNHNLNVRIARFHNIAGIEGSWNNGKEKAPAALCRKVAEAANNTSIDVWGDGSFTRSFLNIEECIEGIRRLMSSDFTGPVNIGSDEMVSINEFAKLIIDISGKTLDIKYVPGPTGVKGRNSDNALIFEKLNWKPTKRLRPWLTDLYKWIEKQVDNKNRAGK